MQAQPCGVSNIRKYSSAIIAVQSRGIIGKVRFENIQPTVAVVIRNRSSHTRLLSPIFVKRNSSHHRDIAKRSVVIVVVKNAWGAVARHINIRPTVIVEVKGRNAERIMPSGLIYMRFGAD